MTHHSPISAPAAMPTQPAPVTRRRVFYLAGFDPRDAAFYHRTYAEQAALQSAVGGQGAGLHYRVSEAMPDGDHVTSWTVDARTSDDPSASVTTRYSFLGWDDIARQKVPRGWPAALGALWRLWSEHLRHGGHTTGMRLARRWAWSLMSLPIFLLLVVLVTGLVGALGAVSVLTLGAGALWATVAGAVVAVLTLRLGWRLALRWNLVWLTHALVGSYDWTAGRMPELDQRMAEHAQRIFDEYRAIASGNGQDVDEVLIVGHCMGTMLAPGVLDRVVQSCKAQGVDLKRLKLLTLASPNTHYALLGHDCRTAPALRALAQHPIDWLDYTAPGDPLCYVLVDALKELGIGPAQRRVNFCQRSARFDKMFDPRTMSQIRHDPLRMHFQYLLATDRPVDNDFFALTAGPKSIACRIAAARTAT